MKEIKLRDWSEFETTLRAELNGDAALVRTFGVVTFDNIDTPADAVEVNSLDVVRTTGTDRRENAWMWNAAGFDYGHDENPAGKKPNEIIYAYLIDLTRQPYLVSVADGEGHVGWERLDLAEDLTEATGIIVYDPSKLHRVAPNEYWFISDPLEAALLLLVVEGSVDQ